MNRYTLQHNEAAQYYAFDLGDDSRTVIEYERCGDVCHLTHTYVPESHQGEGLAAALTEAVLSDLRDRGLRVVPECSYAITYIRRHPEWASLVADGQ